MESDTLNQTQSSGQTANPQNSGSYPGASNGADFQATAPANTLDKARQELSVQETGDPLTGISQPTSGTSAWLWVGGFLAVAVIAAVIIRLLKMDDEPARRSTSTSKPAVSSSKSKAKAAPATKATTKKAPAKTKQQKRRKATKKRR